VAEVKQKVLEFANKVSGTKVGSKKGITADDPRYYIMEPVVSNEMAEVALKMDFRKPKSVAELAKLSGKDEKTTAELAFALAKAGVCFVNNIDGVDRYWYDTWVPGIMEMMVNNKENVAKYPQIGRAFEHYGRIVGPKSVGIFPMGVGVMRVIPIETALQGESRHASYEEVSKYLNENDIFTVTDCSCRTSREVMGEGCGHLKEDMCIQMGHAAEYYIRTGRGRQITRVEAFEIIKRAEENGLLHTIPNFDGNGKTHAICNCCGCSCFALRIANMYQNNDMVRSNFLAEVTKDKCVACGECVVNCPTNAVRLGEKLCTKTPIKIKVPENQRDTEWPAERFNVNYRINRENVVDETGTSPCKTECPAHIAIQGYIKLASEGRYTEALELIKKENPFPAVCGRICPRKCESACTRAEIDGAIAIDEIKKFIADQDLNENQRFVPKKRHDYSDKKIAVIGAGPAGLACAYYLALDGYTVTVFEKEEKPGGMLALGIPAFRLQKDVVNAEIEILKAMGVEIRTGLEVGKDVTLDALRQDGYKGFYMAIGAQAARKLNIEGEDNVSVIGGIEFLRDVSLGKDVKLSGDVVVIGGGNVAIDVARTSTRVGADKTMMFCLENRETMPALEEEIEEALAENVEIRNSYGPKRIIVENGKVTGVEFKKCPRVLDENGRFAPLFDENDIIVVPCGTVLVSVGQSIEWGGLLSGSKCELNPNQSIKGDDFTYQSAQPDVFVGGDCYTGPRFAIDAIAAGKQAAISLHRFVQPGQSLMFGRDRHSYKALDKENLDLQGYDNIPRQKAAHKSVNEKFGDNRMTFTEEQMLNETKRCLGCGLAMVDPYKCVGCGQCTTKCKFDAIHLIRKYDNEGLSFEHVKPAVLKTMIKRKGKIAVKNIKNAFNKNED